MASFNYQELMDEDPAAYDGMVDLLAQLLIHYNLDEIYHENRAEAHKLLIQKMRYENLPFEKRTLVIIDFEKDHKKMLEMIESVNEDNNEEMLMLLVYIVRFLERIINEHIYFELENRDFTQSEIGTILRKFSIDEKISWFLKILSGKDYTKENNRDWSLLKNYIITRNFYIHDAPATFNVHDIHEKKLSKKDFMSFLETSCACYSFLIECRSKDTKDHYEQVKTLGSYIKEQDIKDRKEQYEKIITLKKQVSDLKNRAKELDIKDRKDHCEKIDYVEKEVDSLIKGFKEPDRLLGNHEES